MSADKTAILDWLAALCSGIVTDVADRAEIAARIKAAGALDAQAFAAESIALMRAIAENASAPADFRDIGSDPGFAGDTASAGLVLQALGLCLSGCRIDWPSRQAARSARGQMAEAGRVALAAIAEKGGLAADLYAWLAQIVATCCRYVSDVAANAAPLVRVETGLSLPSTVLAFQLYGDAARAASLVAVARSATPLVMPSAFEALKS